MMEQDYLSIGVGSGVVVVKVNDILVKDAPINRNGDTAKKVVLNCSNGASEKLQVVDEAWVRQRGGEYQNKGLWLSLDDKGENVTPLSALGKLMKFVGVKTLGELLGKEVKGVYKQNGFLSLITEEHTEDRVYTSNR